jgi:hypothetical protein
MYIVLCFCFVCPRLVSCVPYVSGFAGLLIVPLIFSNVYLVAFVFVFRVVFCRSLCRFFLLVILLSFLLRFTASDYLFGIFKLVLQFNILFLIEQ